MDETSRPEPMMLRDARERVVQRLTEGFAADELTLAEFESRIDGTYRSRTLDELDLLVKDLSHQEAIVVAPQASGLAKRGATAIEPGRAREEHAVAMAVFGSVERHGSWLVPETLDAVALFGSVVLDFREVALPPGVTELRVVALFGSVEVIVPADYAVACEGTGIFGAVNSVSRIPPEGVSELPLLRIKGLAMFGAVEVRTKPPAWVLKRAKERRAERQLKT
jgi:hypothetical protein